MKDLLMVPVEQWERLQAKYKGSVNQSALLNKVGRLGATEELLLRDASMPAGMAVALSKPLAQQRANLTKRLKTGQLGSSASYATTEDEPEAMVDTPAAALIKRMLKQSPQTPVPATPQPSTSGLSAKQRKELLQKARKVKIKKEEEQRKKYKKKAIKGAAKGAAKSLGFDLPLGDDSDDDSYDSPGPGSFKKKKGKKKAKRKKTEADKLHFSEPLNRGELDYGPSSDEDFAFGGKYEKY